MFPESSGLRIQTSYGAQQLKGQLACSCVLGGAGANRGHEDPQVMKISGSEALGFYHQMFPTQQHKTAPQTAQWTSGPQGQITPVGPDS